MRDYIREPHSNMSLCGLVVGDEYVTDEREEVTCVVCSQTQFRRDEPEMPLPNVEGMPFQKEERYGD
jgi:hypothetical protein